MLFSILMKGPCDCRVVHVSTLMVVFEYKKTNKQIIPLSNCLVIFAIMFIVFRNLIAKNLCS